MGSIYWFWFWVISSYFILYMEKAMAPYSSTLAWKIPGMGSPWGHYESDRTEWLHFHLHALEKEMATHSTVLAWRIPGMGEPGALLSMGSHRVGHDWSDLAAAVAASFITMPNNKIVFLVTSCLDSSFHKLYIGISGYCSSLSNKFW